jgi:aminoglycoside phosphotransferase (APT) family kinase protein
MESTWLDRPAAVRGGEELDVERLEAYLRRELDEPKGWLAVEQFPSGFSNLTYLLRFSGRQLVLRRPPFGTEIKSAHDMGREFKILSGLAGVYPKAPRPLFYCDDSAVLGAPFYVMERVQGVILRPRMPAAMIPEPSRMATIARELVSTLVELHDVDYRAAGLGDLGRPEGYVSRQVEGWSKRYRKAKTDELPEMEKVASWLAKHLPPEPKDAAAGASLIHNDFKYDNVMLDAKEGTSIVAVLDWEMATVGNPLMDLGTSLGYWLEPGDPPEMLALQLSPTVLPGNPTREQVVEIYAGISGQKVDDVLFYYVYGVFKIAVIIQQIYTRFKLGHTQDPRFASLIHGVRASGRTAWQAAQKRRIEKLF